MTQESLSPIEGGLVSVRRSEGDQVQLIVADAETSRASSVTLEPREVMGVVLTLLRIATGARR